MGPSCRRESGFDVWIFRCWKIEVQLNSHETLIDMVFVALLEDGFRPSPVQESAQCQLQMGVTYDA